MSKLTIPATSRFGFIADLLSIAGMWVVGSSAIGWVAGTWKGHGGIVLLFAAWVTGAIGMCIHLVLKIRRTRKASMSAE